MSAVTISSTRFLTICYLIQVVCVKSSVQQTEAPSNFSSNTLEIFVAGYSSEVGYREKWMNIAKKSPRDYARYVKREEDDITVVNSDRVTKLALGCKASYPIYWEMTDARPTTLDGMSIYMKVSLERNGTNLNAHEFLSSLILSNDPTLTGMYTCRSLANDSYLQSSVYVFMPGHSWRTRKLVQNYRNQETVGINGNDSVVLPCRVTNEDVQVSLFKKEGKSWIPISTNDTHIAFDPKEGYTLYKNELTNLTGKYKCSVEDPSENLVVNVKEEYHRHVKSFPPDIDVRKGNASLGSVQGVYSGDHIQCCASHSKSGHKWKPTLLVIICANRPECDMRKRTFAEMNVDDRTRGASSVVERTGQESCRYALDDVTGKAFLLQCHDGHSVNISGVFQAIYSTPSHKSLRYERAKSSYSIDDSVTLKITKVPEKKRRLSFRPELPVKANPQNDLYEGEKYIFECCGLPYDHAVGRVLQIVWEDGNTTQFHIEDESAWNPEKTDYCSASSDTVLLGDLRQSNENHAVMELGMKYAECIVPLWYSTVPSVKRVELNVRVPKPPVLASNVTFVNVTYTENQLGILQLVCDMSQGDPAPKMTWTKDGEKTSTLDPYYSIIHDPNQDHPKTTILFMRAVKQIEGNYSCTAVNRLGSVGRNFTVTVNPRDYLDYWVSLGVFGGFFALIAMCAVKITMSEKRTSMPRRKQI